jgi:hypothetical protein
MTEMKFGCSYSNALSRYGIILFCIFLMRDTTVNLENSLSVISVLIKRQLITIYVNPQLGTNSVWKWGVPKWEFLRFP